MIPRCALIRLTYVLLTLGVTLAACSSSGVDSDCGSAFRNAEPRGGAPYDASPLDDAIRKCATLAEWRATWNALPDSHPGNDDPVGFLEERCRDAALSVTALCQEVSP